MPYVKIYYGWSDFTTGMGSNPYVWGLIHNIKLAEGEFFFVGNRPEPMPKYQNIIFPFDVAIWILLGTSVPAMVICMSLVYRRALRQAGEKFKVQ